MKKKKATFVYVFLIAYSCITLIPFIWAILTSLKTQNEITTTFSIFPKNITFEAYNIILSSDFLIWLGNSIFVSLSVAIVNVIFNTMAGYALARFNFKGKNSIFNLMLLLIMVPAQVTMIPQYLIVSSLGLVNTRFILILLSAINIAYIFMMRQFFITFPKDVEEASMIDGLGKFGRFFKIVLPMAKPALATQAIFCFMGIWNEFMKPLLYIQDPNKYMITQGLAAVSKLYAKSNAWNVIMAGSVLSIIPILILYIILNKYFVSINDTSGGKD